MSQALSDKGSVTPQKSGRLLRLVSRAALAAMLENTTELPGYLGPVRFPRQ